MPFLYHGVPPRLQGSVIYPLQDLKALYPDLYHAERAKYDGREHTLDVRIPPLDCSWSEVVFLTCVHPREHLDALASAGFVWRKKPYRVFGIDVAKLDSSRLAVLTWRGSRTHFDAFEVARVGEYAHVPDQAREYFRDCAERGQRPLLFSYIPHILHRGPIDVADAVVIEVA